MCNPNEDSFHAPNPNHNVNPTSEVESVPAITVQVLTTIVRELIQSLVQISSVEPNNFSLMRSCQSDYGGKSFTKQRPERKL